MTRKNRILYVFDDINYNNGVRKVTAKQIACLREEYDISLFSLVPPSEHARKLFHGLQFIGEDIWGLMEIFANPLRNVITAKDYNLKQKAIRTAYALLLRTGFHDRFLNSLLRNKLYGTLNKFDIIIVLSESSKMRSIVASLEYPKKIQWIHTNYGAWCHLNEWTKSVCRNDREIYQRFDRIITLSEKNKKSFLDVFPEFKGKTEAIWNMIPVDEIIENSKLPQSDIKIYSGMKFITISRLDNEKAIDRLLSICKRLKNKGYDFYWYIIGGGRLYDKIKLQIIDMRLEDSVILTGELDNPMPLLKQCDVFALLSKYEGMPVTIHEAMILGIPVIATNVGGVSEQIEDGINGLLVENNDEAIFNGLKEILDSPSKLSRFKEQLKNYHYDNQNILTQLKSLFDNI